MADQCHMCLLGLIILCPLLTGTSGAEVTHVFSTSGENVHLPCNNALSGCTSTTWNYNRHSVAVELIAGGIKRNDRERRERLSLGSDCSLNIKKVTQEDYGLYTCRQYVNGQKQGTDAPVYLHFLHVSSSSSQTEIRPDSSVTLYCQLCYYGVDCDSLVRSKGIQLVWVNQAGVNLMTDSRYQISFSSTHCNITLTTTLLNEDLNREWRCLVTQRNQLKTSATYTVKYSAPVDSTKLIPVTSSKSEKKSSRTTAAAPTQPAPVDSTKLIPVTSSKSEKKSSRTTAAAPTGNCTLARGATEAAQYCVIGPMDRSTSQRVSNRTITSKSGVTSAAHRTSITTQQASITETTQIPATAKSLNQVTVIVGVVAALAVLLLAVLWAIRKKKSDNRRGTDDSVEQKDDVTYTEVVKYSKNKAKKNKVHGEDKVTYASISGATAGPQDNNSQLYASVNNNHHK
ncbi:uncharacterized protein LOC125242902 [Megalobrama amblycephala]|uniref:uncharacterized protein LOC125242902 n=1 Tax=Megalobrama amblycephala TaxID=75352 RepID=UPI00201444A8|nr:uncharacterized protein LOC125242902 [Megalobrama amblycephala]